MVHKTRRKKTKGPGFWPILFIIVVLFYVYKSIIPGFWSLLMGYGDDESGLIAASDSVVSINIDNLYSPCAILVSLDDGTILMQKNSEEIIYPASLTKIMTAIVAIENLPNLQEKISISPSTFEDLDNTNASMAGFLLNETVRAIDLVYGVLLPSGAECCMALSENIAGSEQDFVKMMNQKAAELNLSDTHFVNTTGLHNNNHYTTVTDLAILLRYALHNDTFRNIITTAQYSVAPTHMHSDGLTLQSTMFANMANPYTNGGKILGGKTGYTNEAGLCLASLAEEAGKEYILVTAGARGDQKSEQYHIIDAFYVYNALHQDILSVTNHTK